MKNYTESPTPSLDEIKESMKELGNLVAQSSRQAFESLKTQVQQSSTLQDAKAALGNALAKAGDKMQNVKDRLSDMYDSITIY